MTTIVMTTIVMTTIVMTTIVITLIIVACKKISEKGGQNRTSLTLLTLDLNLVGINK